VLTLLAIAIWNSHIFGRKVLLVESKLLTIVILVATLTRVIAATAGESGDKKYYSTCPDLERAVVRSEGYVQATEPELLRWAKSKESPKMTAKPDTVHVQVQVEGERVFCAQALDGPHAKQKAAVEAVMHWRFKKNRGEFKNDLIGILTFRF
jgi:hypothetical protein